MVAPPRTRYGHPVDEDLRAADRLLSFATVEERLRHARALERSGRRDEALAVLLAASDSPEVRSELARWPSWTSENARGTRYLDAPLLASPRVAHGELALAPGRIYAGHRNTLVAIATGPA